MVSVLVVMNGLMIEFVGCIDDVYYIGLYYIDYIDYDYCKQTSSTIDINRDKLYGTR